MSVQPVEQLLFDEELEEEFVVVVERDEEFKVVLEELVVVFEFVLGVKNNKPVAAATTMRKVTIIATNIDAFDGILVLTGPSRIRKEI
ncbi:MAG: hypothetical protein PXY39_03935 [archaeon]|nr:hypothetical protein [archaeon]